ncbi:MAG: Holliday junction resolvase RuvX [Nocardioidaceae bacterium]
MRTGRRLGVDVGDVRIGVALSDPGGLLATPLETVSAASGSTQRLVELARQHEVIELVVGLPVSLSGREGPAAAKVRSYAAQLARAARPLQVRLVDERLTTVTAERVLRERGRKGQRRRAVVDQVAAVEILQAALDAERTSGAPGETLDVDAP